PRAPQRLIRSVCEGPLEPAPSRVRELALTRGLIHAIEQVGDTSTTMTDAGVADLRLCLCARRASAGERERMFAPRALDARGREHRHRNAEIAVAPREPRSLRV